MHIPDGTVDPAALAVCATASAGVVAVSVRGVRGTHPRWGLAGLGAAGVLVAHMLDVPMDTVHTAHVMGGTLLAIALGPWLAVMVMTGVLAVEALLLGDGGVWALGVNVWVMAVVGVLVGWGGYRAVMMLGGKWTPVVAAGVGAWLSVMASALVLMTVEALGTAAGPGPLLELVPRYAAWGGLEAFVTVFVVAGVLAVRPVVLRRGWRVAAEPAPEPALAPAPT